MLSSAEPTARVLPPDRVSDASPYSGAMVARPPDETSSHSRLDGFREGRAEGFEKGFAEGVEAGRAELRRVTGGLATAIDRLESMTQSDVAKLEETAVGLAVEVAQVILERELELSSTVGTDAIRRALSMAIHKEPIVIHMSQEDVDKLDDVVPARLSIVVDPTLSPGCADIHLGDGLVQIDPIEALARVKEALK